MPEYKLNYQDLRNIDKYVDIDNPDKYDEEIEEIINQLWDNTGEVEGLLRPLFTTYLQSNLLRPLYICFLACSQLKKRHKKIEVTASTVIMDIVARHLGFALAPDRTMHDEEFFLVRHYNFSKAGRAKLPYWKRVLLPFAGLYMQLLGFLGRIDVLYLNAGKFDDDFSRIPRAMPAQYIPFRRSERVGCDAHAISEQVRENIRSMKLSIPQALVLELVEKRALAYLPDVVDRIGALTEFIERYGIKLVIASAATHEEHLCLLAAARLAGAESLLLPHGVTLAENPFLHYYVTYQATLSGIEPCYEGARRFPLKAEWFCIRGCV